MSVTVRPYVDGGWEVDIRVTLPDGSVLRERRKAPTASKSAAQRWAESRERVLLVNGKPDRAKEVQQKTTLREFAPRFIESHAKANRLKASGIAAKESVLRIPSCRRLATSRWRRSRPRTCSNSSPRSMRGHRKR